MASGVGPHRTTVTVNQSPRGEVQNSEQKKTTEGVNNGEVVIASEQKHVPNAINNRETRVSEQNNVVKTIDNGEARVSDNTNPLKTVLIGEAKASEQTTTSTAASQNSTVGKPGLIEKAKLGQQHGGTKHETLNGFESSKQTRTANDLDAIRSMLKEALRGGESSIELLNEKVQELIESKQKDTEMIEQLQIKVDELSKQLKEERENNTKLKSTEVQIELATRNKEITDLRKETTELRQEIERLRTSLSKAAGQRMTEGNPEITDLSDPNRPQKLCEKYINLYDTLWTDAFDCILQTKTVQKEPDVCEELLDMFKKCWEFCCACADRQLVFLQDVTLHPELQLSQINKNSPDLSTEEMKTVRDARKKLAYLSLKSITQFFWKTNTNQKEPLRKYINSCLEICWYAAIENPRLHFAFDPKKNRDDFRGYTQSGKYVDYVVWPAMYLHKNGPLMYKGVVQLTDAPERYEI